MCKVVLCLFLLIVSFGVSGGVVSENDAKNVAINWMNERSNNIYSSNDIIDVFIKSSSESPVFFIINFSPIGWVMVAANDNVEPILAYSTKSSFNTNKIPVQVDEWLNGIGREVEESR